MSRIYVSIGSNIDPVAHIGAALRGLRQHFGALTVSPVYESAAVGFDGADFLNLVVGCDTDQTPETVAAVLRELEAGQGRDRGGDRFASRTLDLDLLLWGACVIDRDGLRLPRADILRYAFVLCPLADIAGEAMHPVTGRSYGALWADFDASRQPMRRAQWQPQ